MDEESQVNEIKRSFNSLSRHQISGIRLISAGQLLESYGAHSKQQHNSFLVENLPQHLFYAVSVISSAVRQ